MSNNQPLSKEEEDALFQQYYSLPEKDPEREQIRHRIIESNIGFVIKIAQQYAQKSPNYYNDFISSGYEGLLTAFGKFDPSKGFRFLTYAGFWVREKILKCMASFRVVAVPIINQQLQAKIKQMVLDGMTREEIKNFFPKGKQKLVSRLFESENLTYYIEDIPELTENDLDVDIFSLDKEKMMEFLNDAPEKYQEILYKHFFDNQPVSQKTLSQALDYMRRKMHATD